MFARAARALLQHLVQFHARRMEGRRDAEQQSAHDAESGEISEDGVIHREPNPVRLAYVLGREIEPMHSQHRQAKSKYTAKRAEQHALDEQLTNHSPSRSAERGADGHFPLAAK